MTLCYITRKTVNKFICIGAICFAAEWAVLGIAWLMLKGDLISGATFGYLIIPCFLTGTVAVILIGKWYLRKTQKNQDSDSAF